MAGKSGDQNRRAPHRGQRRQGYPATPCPRPPSARDTPPPAPVPPGFRRRGAGGGSPRRNKPKISPFPTGEGGWGDGGKPCDMAGKSGDQNRRSPPIGDSDGRVIRQRRGKPPARRRIAPLPPCRPGSGAGVLGAVVPGEINQKTPPSRREGGRGDGGKKFMMWQAQPATEKSSHPSKPTAAKKTVSRRRRTPLPPCSQSTSSTRQSGRTVRSDGCSTYRRISLKAEA